MSGSSFKDKPQRSWFCVLNSPERIFGDVDPEIMVDMAIDMWVAGMEDRRSCAVNYEIGETGNKHMHMVLCDSKTARFSAVRKVYEGIHCEPTRGTGQEALDYINKVGKFEEKKHTVVVSAKIQGEILGASKSERGKRGDLMMYRDLIEEGYTPNDIFDNDPNARRFESMIKSDYFRKRYKETPIMRDVEVIWHFGESGTGKTYSLVEWCNVVGEDNVYLVSDYSRGCYDYYMGESVLFMDEFKGVFPGGFSGLLTILDKYRVQLPCRYANSFALWNQVHITSVYSPDEIYKKMVDFEDSKVDDLEQLLRRISIVQYHYVVNGEFRTFDIPGSEFTNRDFMKIKAMSNDSDFF